MSSINMSFDKDVAKDVGTDAAIILSNIEFWQLKNKANNKNFHDGHYWTYNSVVAWNELFDYLTPSKIRRCIEKLEEKKYILTGNYNSSSYDRTKWYCSIRQIHLSKITNGNAKSNEPIPYNKPNINTDNKLNYIPKNQKNDFSAEDKINDIEVIEPEVLKNQKKEKEKSSAKKEKEYPKISDEVYQCYEDCKIYFPEDLLPKNPDEYQNWFETIDKLNRIDGLEFSDILLLVKSARNDKLWSKNFFSLLKLRRKDKDKIPYWKVFKERFKFEKSKSESTFDAMNDVLQDIQRGNF